MAPIAADRVGTESHGRRVGVDEELNEHRNTS
jgi:hypothetical protein